MDRCRFIKADGERCQTPLGINPRTGYCWFHDPARAEERHRARSEGGKQARRNRTQSPHPSDLPGGPPKTMEDAKLWSSWLIHATALGLVDSTTSARVKEALKVFVDSVKKTEQEREIRALTTKLKELQRSG